MEKGGFLQNSYFYQYLIQFWSKFHETSWLYCLFKVSPSALVSYLCVFQFDALLWKKWVSCKNVMKKRGLMQNSNFY